MLKPVVYGVYSFLFKLNSTLYLFPYEWNKKRETLSVTKSNRRTKVWQFIATIQFFHWYFLTVRLYESHRRNFPTSVILFQVVWNVLFLIPVLAQLLSIREKYELADCAKVWLHIERKTKTVSQNTILKFFAIFFPTGALHSLAHAFMYIQNPDQPQYIISVFIKFMDMDKSNMGIIGFFGLIELTLASINWSLVPFYVSFIMGCTCTLDAQVSEATNCKTSAEALVLYRLVRAFETKFVRAWISGVIYLTIVLFTCIVFCVYNTIMSDLPLLPYLLMPLTVVANVTVYIFLFPPLCNLYDHSVECLEKWSRDTQQLVDQKKEWKSFRPIMIAVGSFYSLSSLNVLTFFD